MDRRPVIAVDFDGVLGEPDTHPELFYPEVPEVIKSISERFHLVLASFNPRAKIAVKEWGLYPYFSACRAGANHDWRRMYDPSYQATVAKSVQIKHMLFQIGWLQDHDVWFFDDNETNIKEVEQNMVNVKAVLVDSKVGLTKECIQLCTAYID
jgi:hypothetical protein